MKILHVCSNYFPAAGGPQYIIKNLSEKLVEYYNDEVEVITTDSLYAPEINIYKKIKPAFEKINRVEVKRFPFRTWHYPFLSFAHKTSGKIRKKGLPYSIMKRRWALDSPAINNAMKVADTDVITATTAHYNFSDYPFRRFKNKNAKPFVLYGAIHFNKNTNANSPLVKRALACDCYIANTIFEEKKLLSFGIQPHKIVTIGIGVDPKELHCKSEDVKIFRNRYNVLEDDLLIGHVGRLSKGKGVFLLMDAFAKLLEKKNKIKLLLAGTTSADVELIKQKISDDKLPVILLENFDEILKPVIFNALDIFVLASGGESFGVVFLEAWACCKPVIGSDLGAVAALIDENKNGLLFETGNKKSLAKKLEVLIDNKLIREEFGNNGYKKAVEKYNWKIVVAQYRSTYFKAIENFKKEYSAF